MKLTKAQLKHLIREELEVALEEEGECPGTRTMVKGKCVYQPGQTVLPASTRFGNEKVQAGFGAGSGWDPAVGTCPDGSKMPESGQCPPEQPQTSASRQTESLEQIVREAVERLLP